MTDGMTIALIMIVVGLVGLAISTTDIGGFRAREEVKKLRQRVARKDLEYSNERTQAYMLGVRAGRRQAFGMYVPNGMGEGVLQLQFQTIKKLEDAVLAAEWAETKQEAGYNAPHDCCPWCGAAAFTEDHDPNCIVTRVRQRRRMAEEL